MLDPPGSHLDGRRPIAPAVAFDGTNYLVVWDDYPLGPARHLRCAGHQAGAVLDPAGIAISTAAGNQQRPALAFDGTNYLVVWADHRSGTDYDIYGARVSTAGAVLDATGIAISTVGNCPSRGARGRLRRHELPRRLDGLPSDTSSTLRRRVSPAGTSSTRPDRHRRRPLPETPAVAFDGTNYFVVWQDPPRTPASTAPA